MELIKYLPRYYQGIKEVEELQRAIDNENTKEREKIQDIFKQCDINRATWGLVIWEEMYGLSIGDTLTNIEDRRERVRAKMRSTGTTTIAKLKNIALAFAGAKVDILEHYGEYYIKIKFISLVGRVPDLENFKRAIREVLPAHLGFKIEFRYNTHGDLKEHRVTHEHLQSFTHEQIFGSRVFED